MTELTELNKTINALNDLWPLLKGDEKNKIRRQESILNDRASELADKTLREGVPELTEAITLLKLSTQAAKEAKQSIDNVALRIEKIANTVEKVTLAASKLSALNAFFQKGNA